MIIFDSGVGGLSILKELPRSYSYTYLADQAYFPYGSKRGGVLTKRLEDIANWAAGENPDLVVIACNTATVGGIQLLRTRLSCPVVAVEPVVKPASRYNKALILGTTATLASVRMKKLIKSYKGHILTYTPPGLPAAIEAMDTDLIQQIIESVKRKVEEGYIEAIGLSCTHYPLIKDIFQTAMPGIDILDPSSAVANQVIKQRPGGADTGKKIFLTTGDVLRFKDQIKYYLGVTCEPISVTIP